MARLTAHPPAEPLLAPAARLPAWTRLPNQPATYPRLFVEVAAGHGIAPAAVLARAGLPADCLDDPAGRLSLQELQAILEAVLTLSDNATLGFEAGYRLPLTAHGSLGYALLCAPTARAAIALLERFWTLRGRGVLFHFHETPEAVVFELSPELPMPAPFRDFLFSSMLTSMYRGIGFLLPEAATAAELWLPGAEPAGFAAWQARLPRVHFHMPRAQVRLLAPRQLLDAPLPTANPEALAQALAQCERELALLSDTADPVLLRTRAALVLGAHGYPGPAAIAASLHLTLRTYRRRLQEQGTSYQQLLEDARQRDARALLAQGELEIRRISELLGYADPANFTRAFRQWTGLAPRAWRAGRTS